MGKPTKPYKYDKFCIQTSSDHNTELLLRGFRELYRALEVVSNQLDRILEQVQKGD